jgi:methylmalonyl-CoA carboxyltransferase large subunit
MNSETATLQQLVDSLEALRREVSSLSQRITAVETAAAPAAGADRLNEELLLTISAAIAAYLGVKPHIRQIRLLGSASWAVQGRASIQASHDFLHHL